MKRIILFTALILMPLAVLAADASMGSLPAGGSSQSNQRPSSPAMFGKLGDVHFTAQGYAKLAAQAVEKITETLKQPTRSSKP